MDNDMFYYPPYGTVRRPARMNQQTDMQQNNQQQEVFNIRSVGSREEAVITPVDYFKPTVILGLNHGMIYLKKFNSDTGETIFLPFKYAPDMASEPKYVTMDMFNELKSVVMQSMAKPAKGKKPTQEVAENE